MKPTLDSQLLKIFSRYWDNTDESLPNQLEAIQRIKQAFKDAGWTE